MPYLRPIPSLVFLLLCAYVAGNGSRGLVGEKVTQNGERVQPLPGSVCDLLYSSFVFLFVHATLREDIPLSPSRIIFVYGLVFGWHFSARSSIVKGKTSAPCRRNLDSNLLFWFIDAVAQ